MRKSMLYVMLIFITPLCAQWICEDLVSDSLKCVLDFQDGFISVDGRNLYYNLYTPRSATKKTGAPSIPLIVLHGGPSYTHFSYLPLKYIACHTGQPVILYDQMGCGNSTHVVNVSKNAPELLTIPYYVHELQTVLNHFGFDSVNILGHSWGSMLTLEYLLRVPNNTIRNVVLAGALASIPEWQDTIFQNYIPKLPPIYQRVINRTLQNQNWDDAQFQAVVAYFSGLYLAKVSPNPDCMLWAAETANLEIYVAMNGPAEFVTTGLLQNWDVRDKLKTIQKRTLVMRGEDDESTYQTSKTISDGIPGAVLYQVSNSGHLSWIDNGDEFITAISTWLKSNAE